MRHTVVVPISGKQMRFYPKLIASLFIILISPGPAQATPTSIDVYTNAPTAVRHAAHRLSNYTGIPLETDISTKHSIHIRLNKTVNTRIGKQGYTIRSRRETITISGNNEEGLANGIYTLLRTLMIEQRTDPFSRKWNIEEKPHFTTRSIIVAPYRFGSSFGFAELSPDRWSFEEWKEYIDLMRLTNMTTLTMGSMRLYHPDYPNSYREKWRYEIWKQVMDYCHQIGMKFNWFTPPNMVTQQAFWDNPDKRAVQEAGFWYGNGLNWQKGKDIILKNQKYTLEYFKELDALEIIYSDGGGFSFDDPDPAGYFADATHSYIKLMRDIDNDADFVFWNWTLDFWTQVLIPDSILKKYPNYKTMQDDVIPLLPKNVIWLDTSMLTLIQIHGYNIKQRGNPPLRETALLGKENSFKSSIDFFWYMNPEFALNMFPHPYLSRTIQEARYARDELGVDGVMGYRLAPPMRFINDYTFFRVASDPSLTKEQLVDEVAAMLASKPESQKQLRKGINNLEQFWATHDIQLLEKSEKLFRTLLTTESNKRLEYISNGITFLTQIVRMAQSNVTEEEREKMIQQLYLTTRGIYIFQGLVADIVWTPEAYRFFRARVLMIIDDYNSPYYRHNPHSEVIDRSIYPRATSKPFKLRWPDPTPYSPPSGNEAATNDAWQPGS